MPNYSTLLFEIRDSVAHIILNRPDAANSLNLQLSKDLMEVAMTCSEDPNVRAVLIRGAGKTFCAGGDLKEFAGQGDNLSYHFKAVTTYLHSAVSRFARMDAPVIAAVHGSAAGAGLSLVCACDLVLAAESTKFTVAYTRIGVTPDGSSTYFLPRIVGFKRALELTLTNRLFSAQEAAHWGVVTRVVPDGDLMGQAEALAVQLASGPTLAFGTAKRLIHSGWNESLETQMEFETRGISDIGRTADAREGMAAFLEKRQPNFKRC